MYRPYILVPYNMYLLVRVLYAEYGTYRLCGTYDTYELLKNQLYYSSNGMHAEYSQVQCTGRIQYVPTSTTLYGVRYVRTYYLVLYDLTSYIQHFDSHYCTSNHVREYE